MIRSMSVLMAARRATGLVRGPRGPTGASRLVVAADFSSIWAALNPQKEMDYSKLRARPTSLAVEAAEWATAKVPPPAEKDGLEIAVFAAGCFWGLELAFQRVEGVAASCVGFAQGHVEKPTYDEVCGASTGHTEVTMVTFNPAVVSYAELCGVLFDRLGADALRYHQVGNDRGPQYRSGIYATSAEQLKEATESRKIAQKAFPSNEILTEVEPVGIFWPAEEYHQQYLELGSSRHAPQSAEKGAKEPIRCYG